MFLSIDGLVSFDASATLTLKPSVVKLCFIVIVIHCGPEILDRIKLK